jgi:hypothetical protein
VPCSRARFPLTIRRLGPAPPHIVTHGLVGKACCIRGEIPEPEPIAELKGRPWPPIATTVVRPHIITMPYHRFRVGQTVVAPSGGPDALIPHGLHVIVRLLPLAGREPQYRIRSEVDGLERMVLESQITAWTPGTEKPVPSKPFHGDRRRHRAKHY